MVFHHTVLLTRRICLEKATESVDPNLIFGLDVAIAFLRFFNNIKRT